MGAARRRAGNPGEPAAAADAAGQGARPTGQGEQGSRRARKAALRLRLRLPICSALAALAAVLCYINTLPGDFLVPCTTSRSPCRQSCDLTS